MAPRFAPSGSSARAGIRIERPLRLCPLIALLLLSLAAGGCASYSRQAGNLSNAWESANLERATRVTSAAAERRDGTRNEILWFLEHGAALRAAGNYEESNRAFDAAEERINRHEERARFRVGIEAAAAVTNLNALPYDAYAYDKVMMNTYKALNYLQLGDPDRARVEINRAYYRQRDAVRRNARRIEQARNEARDQTRDDNFDFDRAQRDDRFRSQFDRSYAHLENLTYYADYVNPFSVYLEALYFMADPWSVATDLERARVSFERVGGMVAANNYVREDIQLINDLLRGGRLPPTTYVIFETGRAPVREEVRIDIALWGLSRTVPYIGAAFPNLRFQGRHDSHLTVLTAHENYRTERLASMDSIIAQEFRNEMPVVIAKTLIATATKATAQYAATEATRDSGIIGALVQIGGIIYQIAMNQADLRTWQTLPKEFQIARFPTPEDRSVTLSTPTSPRNIEVEIGDGTVNVIHVKSISRGTPLIVNQFKLQ